MTYVVFTHDELPAPYEAWPEHESQTGGPPIKAQPVQGTFAIERHDGTVHKCADAYGFLTLDEAGELRILTLAEFEQEYAGAEHVRAALE